MTIRTALYSGSFDPLTFGHVDIARRALAFCDRLVVAVGTHHGKTPRLSADVRMSLIEKEIGAMAIAEKADFAVVTFDGLVVEAAVAHGAGVIVRGVRNLTDFDYEVGMAQMNATLESGVETVFLAASPEVGFISSTLVRQISAMGGDISAFVPESVRLALAGS